MGRIIGRNNHLLNRIYYSFFDLFWGLHYGYPLCCIAQFIYENFWCIASAKHRWEEFGVAVDVKYFIKSEKVKKNIITTKDIKYVPCNKCMRKIIREYNV